MFCLGYSNIAEALEISTVINHNTGEKIMSEEKKPQATPEVKEEEKRDAKAQCACGRYSACGALVRGN